MPCCRREDAHCAFSETWVFICRMVRFA
jgi:hypothetical protein